MKNAIIALIISLSLISVAFAKDCPELLTAAQADDYNKVSQLLKEKCDVNTKSSNGTTALHAVSIAGYFKVGELLLENGADVNAANEAGVNALILVSHIKIIEQLTYVEMEKDEKLAKMFDKAPEAVKDIVVKKLVDYVTLLLDKGADINSTVKKGAFTGVTPAMSAAMSGNRPVLELLIKRGADLNLKDKMGNTALSLAHKAMNDTIVKMLEEAGAKQ